MLNRQINAIILLTVALCLGSTSPSLSADSKGRKTYQVDLEIYDNAGYNELVVRTSARKNGCNTNAAKKGCVTVAENYSGDIYFRIKGDSQCARGQQWALDGVQLAGEDAADKPSLATWTTNKVPLSAQVAEDFNADSETGQAGFGQAPNGGIWIHSKNRTSLPRGAPGTAGYSVWYRLRATCGGDANTAIFHDPKVRNTGNR